MCDRFPSLAAKRRATEAATASIAKCDTEEQVLQHLLDTKPVILGCGQEIWMDKPHIETYIKGYIEKLRRHGLHDRSARLEYLQSTLRKKWSDKPQVFLTMMGFLLEMRNEPEHQYGNMEVNTCEYSVVPDALQSQNTEASQSLKLAHEQLKQEILDEIAQEREQMKQEEAASNSANDSELSDWESSESLSEEESMEEEDRKKRLQANANLEESQEQKADETTLFMDQYEPVVLDVETLKKSWQSASKSAVVYLRENVRQVQLIPLRSQPVISSLLDLHLLFGQFWEWKKSHSLYRSPPKLEIMNETDIIREILWQFAHPNTLSSPTFIYDWRLSPKVMISTLSQSSLRSIVNKYGKVLHIVEDINRFIKHQQEQQQFHAARDDDDDDDINTSIMNSSSKSSPMILQDLAHSLADILLHISNYVGSLEGQFQKSWTSQALLNNNNSNSMDRNNMTTSKSTSSPITLLQMDKSLRYPVLVLEALAKVLSQSVGDLKVINQKGSSNSNGDGDSKLCDEPWFTSIKLISALEMALTVEDRVEVWRILLFLFLRCLHSFFHEFFAPLQVNTLEWSDSYNSCSLFERNKDLNISDNSFWTSAIQMQPYKERLAELGIKPLSCLETTAPKMLTVLKTCEMLRQLTDTTTNSSEFSPAGILGQLPPIKNIVEEFSLKIDPTINFFHSKANQESKIARTIADDQEGHEMKYEIKHEIKTKNIPDYKSFFDFLPLSDRRVLKCFQSILKKEMVSQSIDSDGDNSSSCPDRDDKNRLEKLDSSDGFLSLKHFLQITAIPYVQVNHILPGVLEKFIFPVHKRCEESLWTILQDYQVDENLRTFREIILGGREDFAQAVVKLAQTNSSSRFAYEDPKSRDPAYQKLLFDCYPDGREGFEIEFRLDSKSDMNCKFLVTPKFPMNLILSTDAIQGYLNVSKQLHRIRKSLWTVTNLSMKDCKTIEGVELKRAFLFRFSLIHFCSSLRAFFMLKIFTNNNYTMSKSHDSHMCGNVAGVEQTSLDLDLIIKEHDDYVHRIDLKLLKIKLMDQVIIKRMVTMSESLRKCWKSGISMKVLITLEDCLNKCWSIVNDFSRSGCSTEFNELYFHLGPPPEF